MKLDASWELWVTNEMKLIEEFLEKQVKDGKEQQTKLDKQRGVSAKIRNIANAMVDENISEEELAYISQLFRRFLLGVPISPLDEPTEWKHRQDHEKDGQTTELWDHPRCSLFHKVIRYKTEDKGKEKRNEVSGLCYDIGTISTYDGKEFFLQAEAVQPDAFPYVCKIPDQCEKMLIDKESGAHLARIV